MQLRDGDLLSIDSSRIVARGEAAQYFGQWLNINDATLYANLIAAYPNVFLSNYNMAQVFSALYSFWQESMTTWGSFTEQSAYPTPVTPHVASDDAETDKSDLVNWLTDLGDDANRTLTFTAV